MVKGRRRAGRRKGEDPQCLKCVDANAFVQLKAMLTVSRFDFIATNRKRRETPLSVVRRVIKKSSCVLRPDTEAIRELITS